MHLICNPKCVCYFSRVKVYLEVFIVLGECGMNSIVSADYRGIDMLINISYS